MLSNSVEMYMVVDLTLANQQGVEQHHLMMMSDAHHELGDAGLMGGCFLVCWLQVFDRKFTQGQWLGEVYRALGLFNKVAICANIKQSR